MFFSPLSRPLIVIISLLLSPLNKIRMREKEEEEEKKEETREKIFFFDIYFSCFLLRSLINITKMSRELDRKKELYMIRSNRQKLKQQCLSIQSKLILSTK
jgi:hypothetical protein